jgi:Sel1 repeat
MSEETLVNGRTHPLTTMSEHDNSRSLIFRPDVSLGKVTAGPKRVLSDMVGETLSRVRRDLAAVESAEDFYEKGNESYYMGQGTPEDQTEAVSWYLKAARLGHAHAQYFLGVSYNEGLGVQVDTVEAYQWFKLAADQGVEDAQSRVEELTSVLEQASLIESQTRLARHGQPVETAKFRIGEYEWCKPDHRQILLWAEETGKRPEAIIQRLVELKSSFAGGHLIEVHWDDTSTVDSEDALCRRPQD